MVYLKCADVVTKISDIIDGRAPLMTRLRFHSHMMMCRNCRRYFNQFKKVTELAGQVGQDDLLLDSDWPEDFDLLMSKIMAEIDREGKHDG